MAAISIGQGIPADTLPEIMSRLFLSVAQGDNDLIRGLQKHSTWAVLKNIEAYETLLSLDPSTLSLIKILDLVKLNINDAQLEELVRKCPNLTSLTLHNCRQITGVGLASLSALPLRSLNLSGCDQMTDADLGPLARASLTRLDLSRCSQITGAGLASLSELPLRSLNLSGCDQMIDADLGHLARMPLTDLALSRCSQITDTGLASLSALPLVSLHVASCPKTTDRGIRDLGRALGIDLILLGPRKA